MTRRKQSAGYKRRDRRVVLETSRSVSAVDEKDKKCPVHDKACRKCGRTGHFHFRCPQGHPRRGGRFDMNAGTGRGSYRNGCDRNKFRLSAGPIRRESPDCAFTIGQNSDILSPDRGMATLTVGGVDLAGVLIDCGATCNLMGQQTWGG